MRPTGANSSYAEHFAGRSGAGGVWVFVALALGLAGAPSLAAEPRPPVRSLLEIRRSGVVVQKFDISCGAAALATILRYQHG